MTVKKEVIVEKKIVRVRDDGSVDTSVEGSVEGSIDGKVIAGASKIYDNVATQASQQYDYIADQASKVTGTERHIAGPIALALLLVALTSFFLWLFKLRNKKQTVIMLGPRGSGKTHIFGKIASHKFIDTVASKKPNAVKITFSNKSVPVSLIDVPSSDRLDGEILHRYEGDANGVIFVLDGSKFQGFSKDVAGYLYDVMVDSKLNKKPMLIVVNKSNDGQIAEIRRVLEVELDNMRKNPANSSNAKIGTDGKPFAFKDVKSEPEWVTLRDVTGERDDLETKARLTNVDPGIEKIKKWLAYL